MHERLPATIRIPGSVPHRREAYTMMQERGRWQKTRCHWHVGTVRNNKAELNQDGRSLQILLCRTGIDLGPLSLQGSLSWRPFRVTCSRLPHVTGDQSISKTSENIDLRGSRGRTEAVKPVTIDIEEAQTQQEAGQVAITGQRAQFLIAFDNPLEQFVAVRPQAQDRLRNHHVIKEPVAAAIVKIE